MKRFSPRSSVVVAASSVLLCPLVAAPRVWCAPAAQVATAADARASGQVVGPDDKPVAGAIVVLYSLDWRQELAAPSETTDAQGRFSFPIAATSSIRAREVTGAVGSVAIKAVGLGLGGGQLKKSGSVFRLQPEHAISGTVVDEAGLAVKGALVRLGGIMSGRGTSGYYVPLKGVSALEAMFSTRTATDGTWTINGVPPTGEASFDMYDPDYVRDGASVDLANDSDIKPLIARAGGKISGRVLLPDNVPLAGARISAVRQGEGNGYSEAVNDKEGRYVLTGLSAGTYKIMVTEPSGEWVEEAKIAKAEARKTTEAADIVMGHGVLVSGTVVDAVSGLPLAGASINAQGPHGSSSSKPTDDQGRYQVRVVPGANRFSVNGAPSGYLTSFWLSDNGEIEIAQGQPPLAPFKLKKGLSLHGTALDEAGRPASGAVIKIGAPWDFTEATVDEKGEWALDGVRPGDPKRGGTEGEIKFSATDEWQIVRPRTVKVPSRDAIALVLRRVTLASLRGRVVSPQGEPVKGASLQVRIMQPGESNGWSYGTATSGKGGAYSVPKLRPDSTITVSVKKPGWKFVSGGAVTRQGDDFAAADLIMTSLSAIFAGRALDAKGAPVAKAQAISFDSDTPEIAVADAQGRFSIPNLAAGATRVMAARNYDFGEAKGEAKGEAGTKRPIAITLQAGKAPPAQSLERAIALLEDLRKSDKAGDHDAARYLSRYLVAHDPDMALKYAAKTDGTIDDSIRSELITRLIKLDPGRAAQWAPAQLEAMRDMSTHARAELDFAIAIAEIAPEQATAILRRARKSLNPNDFSLEAATTYSQLAALAGRLKLPEAANLVDLASGAVEQSTGADNGENMAPYTAIVAQGGIALVRRMIGPLELKARIYPLGNAIPALARRDAANALILLNEMAAAMKAAPGTNANPQTSDNDRYHESPDQLYGVAAYAVIKALSETDFESALALARKTKVSRYTNHSKANAIIMVLNARPAAATEAILRETMDEAAASNYDASGTTARVAALAQRLDARLGQEFFARVKAEALAAMSPGQEYYRPFSIAPYAFYHAGADPAQSRLLLEAEWARRIGDGTDGDDYGRSNNLRLIAQAMTAVDLDRALEMARSIPDGMGQQTSLRSHFLRYVLASDAERRVMTFEQFGTRDE